MKSNDFSGRDFSHCMKPYHASQIRGCIHMDTLRANNEMHASQSTKKACAYLPTANSTGHGGVFANGK